jgi:DNA-binding MarR family transcriptional regulator
VTDDTEPRWLSPEQADAWLALISVTIWLPDALDTQLRRDAGITHAEYLVLSWLSMTPRHTARMSEIAAAANVTLSHLSRIAGRLEQRGWLRREPDPDDGRATIALLTNTGWDKVVATAPGHAGEVRRLVFDQLSPEQVRQLRRISEEILRIVRPGQPASPLPRIEPAGGEAE